MSDEFEFRRVIVSIFKSLTEEQRKIVAVVYNEQTSYPEFIEIASKLLERGCIKNCKSDLMRFRETLDLADRHDLQETIDSYIERTSPPQEVPVGMPARTTSAADMEVEQNDENATISVPPKHGGSIKKKDPLQDKNLEDAISIDSPICYKSSDDSNSDDSDGSSDQVDLTPEDKKFMQLAFDAAKHSKDTNTKVGAVVVDKDKENVLGTGWNRMPKKCEGKFSWARDGAVEAGKHFYVLYGARAAIIDALKNKHDLEGTILYTTLNPGNGCAQIIMEVGIKEVVYVCDKFHDKSFMEASRLILEDITCRKIRWKGQ